MKTPKQSEIVTDSIDIIRRDDILTPLQNTFLFTYVFKFLFEKYVDKVNFNTMTEKNVMFIDNESLIRKLKAGEIKDPEAARDILIELVNIWRKRSWFIGDIYFVSKTDENPNRTQAGTDASLGITFVFAENVADWITPEVTHLLLPELREGRTDYKNVIVISDEESVIHNCGLLGAVVGNVDYLIESGGLIGGIDRDTRTVDLTEDKFKILKESLKSLEEIDGENKIDVKNNRSRELTKSYELHIQKELDTYMRHIDPGMYDNATKEVKFLNPDDQIDSYSRDVHFDHDLEAFFLCNRELALKSNSLVEYIELYDEIVRKALGAFDTLLTKNNIKKALYCNIDLGDLYAILGDVIESGNWAFLIDIVNGDKDPSETDKSEKDKQVFEEIFNFRFYKRPNDFKLFEHVKWTERNDFLQSHIVQQYDFVYSLNDSQALSKGALENDISYLEDELQHKEVMLKNREVNSGHDEINQELKSRISELKESVNVKKQLMNTGKYTGDLFASICKDSEIDKYSKILSSLIDGGLAIIAFSEELLSSRFSPFVKIRRRFVEEGSLTVLCHGSSNSLPLLIFTKGKKEGVVKILDADYLTAKDDLKKGDLYKGSIEYAKKIEFGELEKHQFNLSVRSLWNQKYFALKEELQKYESLWDLGDICKIRRGLVFTQKVKKQVGKKGIPVVHAANIVDGLIDFDSVKEYLPEFSKEDDSHIIRERCVLLVQKEKYTIVAEYNPRKSRYKAIIVPTYITILIPNEKEVHFDYLLDNLESELGQKQLLLFAKTPSHIPYLSVPGLRTIRIPRINKEAQSDRVRERNIRIKRKVEEENKVLRYLRTFTFRKTLKEMMQDFASYIADEVGKDVEVEFREKTGFESLEPFTATDIKEGTPNKEISESEVAILVHVDDKPYGVIVMKGKEISNKINSQMYSRFSTVASFIVQSYLNVREASEQKMADFIAHEFKNACQKMVGSTELIADRIDKESVKDSYILPDDQIEKLTQTMGTVRDDYKLTNYMRTNVVEELKRIKNIAERIYEYGKMNRQVEFSKLELIRLIEKIARNKNVKFNPKLKEVFIEGVENPLERAISNLIDNGVENSPDKFCEVTLTCAKDGIVTLSIKNKVEYDMPDDLIMSLGERPINSSKKGGMGFYFAKRIVEDINNGSFARSYNKKLKEFEVLIEFIRKG